MDSAKPPAAILIPDRLRDSEEVRRLVTEINNRSELIRREERMGRMVEAISAAVSEGEWVKGTDAYRIPGEARDRLVSILKRCENDFEDEIRWTGGKVEPLG